jgi:hypothetical protein
MNKKTISICSRDNSCRIAAYTYFASRILRKHGFICDESYANSGRVVRYIHPDKGWIIAVTAFYADVRIENHTEGGIPSAHDEPFFKDLVQDGLFEPSIQGAIDADFESPLEEVWRCIAPHLSNEDIVAVFTSYEAGGVQQISQPGPRH